MKIPHKMELVLISITTILCIILVLKFFQKLRSILPWYANCWFCNCNVWVKYPVRNCWTCPKCEQYNGFTKDGDYNKVLTVATEEKCTKPKVFQNKSPGNGLCKMCNINQQLKVAQLANFVPMNEKSFKDEVESYSLQLEKAYKLCSPCKNVLQSKLHKEKELFLGSKLLETRMPEKKHEIQKEKQNKILRNLINGTSMFIAVTILFLVVIEFYNNMMRYKNLLNTIRNIWDVVYGLLERTMVIIKTKAIMTFPYLENDFFDINMISNMKLFEKLRYEKFNSISNWMQKVLGGFVCSIQIVGHVWSVNKLDYSIVIDFLWSVYTIISIWNFSVSMEPIILSVVKLSSILGLIVVYKRMKMKSTKTVRKLQTTPKKSIFLANGHLNSPTFDDDNVSSDTDDDVSLSKFGLNTSTDSSNGTESPLNNSFMNGRSFSPRTESVRSKPKYNLTSSVNSVMNISPNSISDSVFVKPSFKKYQKLMKDDSDSELDESISTLCISGTKKANNTMNNSVFSIHKFNAASNFVAPTPLSQSRPLISPSKLGHQASWVAGGYWGSEGQMLCINGSRSSSQSSGFESQTSSTNQRNFFSNPPSPKYSECGEADNNSLLLDRFKNFNVNNYNFQNSRNFIPISTPVFPQMQYNCHVQIPQPRLAQKTFVTQNVFAQQSPFSSNSIFKTPYGSGLIKLPQDNSFISR